MKLLHINVTFSKGSTGSIIKNINNYIEENYKDINTYVAYSAVEENAGGFRFINDFEFFILRVFRKLFGKSLFGLYFPTKRLIKYIENIKPDIIHLHTIHHQTLDYKMLFSYLSDYKGKVIYSLHDCWPFTGGCYYYSPVECNNFLHGCDNCPNKKSELDCRKTNVEKEFIIKRKLISDIPDITFVAVSNWLAEEACKSYLKDKAILTIHNGIDTEIFKPKIVKRDKGFTALSVATYWSKRKNLSALLEFAKEFKDMQFLVVGDVDFDFEPQKYTNVTFCGIVKDSKKLCEIYNSADVFLNLSTAETFGLVTAEAMACGLPVIAFNKTACGEIVAPQCGFVVDSIEDYKKAILHIKENDLSQYKVTCRNNVQNFYTKNIMCRKYADLYLDYKASKFKE